MLNASSCLSKYHALRTGCMSPVLWLQQVSHALGIHSFGGNGQSVPMEHLAQLTIALVYQLNSVFSSFHWQIAGTCKAPLHTTRQNLLFHSMVTESAALEKQVSVGSQS